MAKPRRKQDLAVRLLHLVASRLGPALDQIDVVSNREGLRVRALLLDLCVGKGPSPTEVRCALLDLPPSRSRRTTGPSPLSSSSRGRSSRLPTPWWFRSS